MNTVKSVTEYLKTKSKVFFYGAGKYAKRLEKQFVKLGVNVDAYVVTERGNNPLEIDGKKVWTKEELLASDVNFDDIVIVVAIKGTKYELMDQFMDCGLKSLFFLTNQFYDDLWRVEQKESYEDAQAEYDWELEYPLLENNHIAITERGDKKALFRVVKSEANLVERLLEFCHKEIFEEEYGPLKVLSHSEHAGISKELAEKYGIGMHVVTSHFDKTKVEDMRLGSYELIQVGAAMTDIRIGCKTDNTGDNISHKNRDYCECTAFYWMWKNALDKKYLGLSHYRRRLMLDDAILEQMQKDDIKAVVTIPQFCPVTIREFIERYIFKRDWEFFKNAVKEYDAVYGELFDEHEKSHFFFPCNIFLMERSYFEKYCEFAFSVAQKVEDEYVKRGIVRQDRYMGYLFEVMTSLFMKRYYKELNVHCTDVEWMN